jgi:hypothetical protein
MEHRESTDEAVPPRDLVVMDEPSPLRSFGFRYLEMLRGVNPERAETLAREGRLLERAKMMEAEAEVIFRSGIEALRARDVSPMEATELLTAMIEDHFFAREAAL